MHNLKTHAALSFAGVVATASLASGQCVAFISDIPDFDQRRQISVNITGLPNNGDMYCIPTSSADALAYYANRGFPGAFNGPRDWQSNTHYNFVGDKIAELGVLFKTSPTGGTGGSEWKQGLDDYINQHVPGKFVATRVNSEDGVAPSVLDLYKYVDQGAVVSIVRGRYEWDPLMFVLTRTGGHVTTLWYIDVCNPTAEVGQRDPWTDGANKFAQSSFSHSYLKLSLDFQNFQRGNGPFQFFGMWKFDAYSTPSYLDGYMALQPVFTISGDTQGQLSILKPIQPLPANKPVVTNRQVPGGSSIIHVEMHPNLNSYLVMTFPPTMPQIWSYDPVDDAFTSLLMVPQAGPMTTSRFGDLYLVQGNVLTQYDLATSPPTAVGIMSLPFAPEAMAYDDLSDSVYAVSTSTNQVATVSRDLTSMLLGNFPTGFSLVGTPSMDVSPVDGSIWITSSGSRSIHNLVVNATGGLTLLETATHPLVQSPTGLQMDAMEKLLFVSGGVIRHLERVSLGVWQEAANSDFAGLPAGATFRIAKGRSNWSELTMGGADDINFLPTETLSETQVCLADCDFSTGFGTLDIFDFLCFQNLFVAQDPTACDCDTSTGWHVCDVFDFLCFQDAFVGGCP